MGMPEQHCAHIREQYEQLRGLLVFLTNKKWLEEAAGVDWAGLDS
jgi:hypothetical protein